MIRIGIGIMSSQRLGGVGTSGDSSATKFDALKLQFKEEDIQFKGEDVVYGGGVTR